MTNQERVAQITMLAEQLCESEEMAQSVLNDINRQMAERQAVIEGLEQRVEVLEAENNQLLEVCREFAARNPKWMCDGKEQDPLGAHALLARLAAARKEHPEKEPK